MTKEKFYFSVDTLCFYPLTLRDDYEKAGTWPDDAIEVSQDLFTEFTQNTPEGKVRGSDEKGNPIWVDAPQPTNEQMMESAKAQKDGLVFEATQSISLLQTKLLLGRNISEEEKILLNAWIDYIEALESLDLTSTKAIKWPAKP